MGSIFGRLSDRLIRAMGVGWKDYSLDTSEVNFELARLLYDSDGTDVANQIPYFGSQFCRPYVDTMAAFIGRPSLSSPEGDKLIKSLGIPNVVKVAEIDGRTYARLLLTDVGGVVKVRLQAIPREWVDVQQDVITGQITAASITRKLVWTPYGELSPKQARVVEEYKGGRYTLKHESGDPISGFTELDQDLPWGFVPIVELVNAKSPHRTDGRCLFQGAYPFMKAYHDNIINMMTISKVFASPKPYFPVNNPREFLKMTFGLTDAQIDSGNATIDYAKAGGYVLGRNDGIPGFLSPPNPGEMQLEIAKLLYYLIIETTMPEYLYGASMEGENATAQTQSTAWDVRVDDKRNELTEAAERICSYAFAIQSSASGRKSPEMGELTWVRDVMKKENSDVQEK